MNSSKTLIISLFVLVLLPGLTSCREEKPAGLVFEQREYFLHPEDSLCPVLSAVYPSGEERPAAGAEFFSSRPETFLVDAAGAVTVSPSGPGAPLSGEGAFIVARWEGLEARCRVIIRKSPDKTADPAGRILDPPALDAMVNKSRYLPEDYIPADLVRVAVPTCLVLDEVNHLREPASRALSELFAAARAEAGHELTARSGYRAYVTQKNLYNNYVRTQGQEYADQYSARPGTSEHQTGLVMDITSPGMNFALDESFGSTSEGKWVAENAHRFGFIIRYPLGKEDITGYAYEPWHLRYVGPALAEELYRRGLVMEEFFGL